MEFLDDGDLYQKIVAHQKANTAFDEETIWRTLIHVTLGLKRLHDFNILHRDLKVSSLSLRVPMFSSIRLEWLN
jgi:NIMA (never in mitosis gene a)-related kinase